MRAAHQRHGYRQYMRTSRQVALLRRRVGEEHPLLPRTAGHGPGRAPATGLVRAVRPQRLPMLDAPPRGAAVGRRGSTRVTHGRRPRGGLHGPHTDLPGAGGEAESAPRGLRGVLLSEGHRPLHDR